MPALLARWGIGHIPRSSDTFEARGDERGVDGPPHLPADALCSGAPCV
jgi:hypothetical protein